MKFLAWWPKPVTTLRELRIAVILGRMGSHVHGLIDGRRPFDDEEGFVTGTVGGLLSIAWGLAERGHQVDAFCDAKEVVVRSTALAGASIYPIANHMPDDTYDVYLSILEPDLLRGVPTGSLRIVAQWLNGFGYCKPGFDDYVDLYACPSMTHLAHIARTTEVGRQKLVEVPLSINPELYDRSAERRPWSVAYASSPDRGLHNLLSIWPEVRRRVPGAELRVYYRVTPWLDEILSDLGQRGSMVWKRAKIASDAFKEMGTNGRDGLYLIGPLPPRKMLAELSRTEVLAYPCEPVKFTEGFSVTMLDGCAAGCVPMTSDADALGELWWGAAHVIRGKPSEKKEEWTRDLVKTLTDPTFAAGVRGSATTRARELTRQRVAARWEAVIADGLAMKKS